MQDSRRIERGNRSRNRGGSRRSNSGKAIRHRPKLFCLAMLWTLLIINVFLLLYMRGRLRSVDENLNQVLGRVEVLEEDIGIASSESIGGVAEAAGNSGTAAVGYVAQVGLEQVDRPKERTYREIVDRLRDLGKGNSLIQQVAENAGDYPEQLLEALANNPELGDFAVHYLEKKGTVTGEGLTESEMEQEFPLFLQWDPRWGYASYGEDSVVGLSGCGPTALSMVLYYLTGDESLTPDKIAAYSMENGYYFSGTGTAWLLLEDVPPLYGVSVSQPATDALIMRQALDRGEIIICSMSPGDFTIGGHFIVIYGYTREGFLVNDPNCVARSRQSWTYEQLESQIKNMWVFRKGSSTEPSVIQFYGEY